jgi:uncharacterized delta-60 repeat protein
MKFQPRRTLSTLAVFAALALLLAAALVFLRSRDEVAPSQAEASAGAGQPDAPGNLATDLANGQGSAAPASVSGPTPSPGDVLAQTPVQPAATDALDATSVAASSSVKVAAGGAAAGSPPGADASQDRVAAAPAPAGVEQLNPPPVPVAEILAGADLSNPAERDRVVAELSAREQERKNLVVAKAAQLGIPLRIDRPDGGIAALHGFRGEEPFYRITFNANAAISSAANLIRPAPYNLIGTNMTVGVWDGGAVLATHQEMTNRVTIRDAASPSDDHATHVAGTIIASGVQTNARGMAPAGLVDSYDWDDDIAEMTAAGAATTTNTAKLPISNHSYGYGASTSDMGRYDSFSEELDSVSVALPFYLQFWAAGNEQDELTSKGGFQSITHGQLAKNILTVGAVNDAVTAGLRDATKATMSSFSSWGPCDDGRIKPDVVANGVQVYSPIDTSNTSYANYNGTSMASPSAAGSALLLAELYRREFPATPNMRASLLKALLIHTADDRGNKGPDFKFGWGLINVKAAADLILAHKADPLIPRFYEGQVTVASNSQTHTFVWDGASPIRATLCWTDPAGAVQTAPDSRTPNLVHNLDLKITAPDGTTVYQPFIMPFVGTWTQASMNALATTGKNNVDNVEQVLLENTATLPFGTYTATVSLDGALTTASQRYSLVVSGAGTAGNPPPVVRITAPLDGLRHLPGSPLNISVSVTDRDTNGNAGTIGLVELMTNGTKVADLPGPPYAYTLTPTNTGLLVLTARATDVDPDPKTNTSPPVNVDVSFPPAGSVRESFVPPVLNDFVQALASDEQNRIYIGGLFTTLNGTNAAPRIARLLPTGAVDEFFPGTGPNSQVMALAYSQAQQGLYMGGSFSEVNGVARPALARLAIGQSGQPDGTLDTGFNAEIEAASGGGAPSVRVIALQDDGKILVGGSFARVKGQPRVNLARLMPDGTPDPGFAPNFGGTVQAVALQPDGKILVGGAFTTVDGLDRKRLVRLNRDGSVDLSFVVGSGFDGPVNAIAVSLSGEVFAGGQFTSYNGRGFYNNMVKLSLVGTVDGTFNFTAGLSGVVNNLQLRPTGEILVSGLFTSIANSALGLPTTPVGRVLQIKPDGSPDEDFNTGGVGANGGVLDSILMGNGDILLAGSFTTFNTIARARLVVLSGSEGTTPVITSPLFYNVDSGGNADFTFTASGPGPFTFSLTGALPQGVTFDSGTGQLTGVPLGAGRFDLEVVATSAVTGSSAPTAFVLFVNARPIPYDVWKGMWFSPADQTNAAVSGMLAVRNPDGLSNLLVYALGGGDPSVSPPDLRPVVQREPDGGTNYLTLTASKFPAAEVTYRVEYSTTLQAWTSDTNAVTILTNTPTEIKARATTPWTNQPKQFLRLKVIAP